MNDLLPNASKEEKPSHEKTRTTNSGEDIDSFPR
jgi:hypothetical protein